MESSLSKDSSNILIEFTSLILRNGNESGSKSVGLIYDSLNQWANTIRKDKKVFFNIIHRALNHMLPMITKESLFIRYCMALEWIQKYFMINVSTFVESVPYLKKPFVEYFDNYVLRIQRVVQKLSSYITLQDIIESIHNAYIYNLTSVYLPTKYFPELTKGEREYIPYAVSAILDDPYPRSVSEWKERIASINTLFDMNAPENEDLLEMEIPNVDMIIRRNKSPNVASSLPFTSQLLSEDAMMAMVKKWDVREKFYIRIGTFLRGITNEEPLTLLDSIFIAFFHGLMQYFATKGQITPLIDERYKKLYRGLRPTKTQDMIDQLFPLDELGTRKSYKEKGIIATSFTRSISEEHYTKTEFTFSVSEIKRGLLMIIDIEGSKAPFPIAPIIHTTYQDEVLLLPGTLTFVNHVEVKPDYDIVLVKYTPDLTMMKLFSGVYELYQQRLNSMSITTMKGSGSRVRKSKKNK
uniref:Uncharacterized protein n=1 Tax=viral metagenome TaxID=1070528 RepID=A0A6C0CTW8_9ZZZZ